MWLEQPVNGRSLPNKTLCLTFDDGPGPHTRDIAHYLAEQRICAAFFVVGKHVQQRPGDVAELRALGHQVGNHSLNHLHLTDNYLSVNDICAEITAPLQLQQPVLFRPPYGAWTPRLSHLLNMHTVGSAGQFGPVNWDIGGFDFKYWMTARDPESCAEAYRRSVKSNHGKGIVLFHDHSADLPATEGHNKTLTLLQILIRRLRSEGYTFTSLSSVPAIHRLLTV